MRYPDDYEGFLAYVHCLLLVKLMKLDRRRNTYPNGRRMKRKGDRRQRADRRYWTRREDNRVVTEHGGAPPEINRINTPPAAGVC